MRNLFPLFQQTAPIRGNKLVDVSCLNTPDLDGTLDGVSRQLYIASPVPTSEVSSGSVLRVGCLARRREYLRKQKTAPRLLLPLDPDD